MNWGRIRALVLRYTFLYTRSVPRVAEMFFWPVMDLLVWGFITVYLQKLAHPVPATVTFLLGSMIFWDILYRAQQAVTISFLEDIWARNLLNIFVAPIRVSEFIAATYIVGFVKILVTVGILAGLALWFYHWNLFQMGLPLIPLFASLLLMGWAVGMITTALIMRWGQSAEALAWGIPFLIQPVCAVFYPLNVLPSWIQPISRAVSGPTRSCAQSISLVAWVACIDAMMEYCLNFAKSSGPTTCACSIRKRLSLGPFRTSA